MDSEESVNRAKHELRSVLLGARATRSPAELERCRTELRRHLIEHAAQARWRRIAAYEPLRTEPGSVELLAELTERGVDVLVPTTLDDRDLDWSIWLGGPAGVRQYLGVDAIRNVDAVLVPALAVSRLGVRLGRGGGSYDRALTRVAEAIPVAALIFDDELVDALPSSDWDRPVRAVVQPSGWRDL